MPIFWTRAWLIHRNTAEIDGQKGFRAEIDVLSLPASSIAQPTAIVCLSLATSLEGSIHYGYDAEWC